MTSGGGDVRFLLRRPGWLTAGTVRLLVLAGFVVAIQMIPWRVERREAVVAVVVAAGAAVAAGIWFSLATRRVLDRLPLLEGQANISEAVLQLIRRVGLPLLGLAFFLAWTFVYLALWATHPNEAFRGLEREPRFADFFYYAASTAFTSPPEDIVAGSRGVRSATLLELLSALALLTTYLSSLVEWRPLLGDPRLPEPEPQPPPER